MQLQFHNHRGAWPIGHPIFFRHAQQTYLVDFRPPDWTACGPGASKLHGSSTKDMG